MKQNEAKVEQKSDLLEYRPQAIIGEIASSR